MGIKCNNCGGDVRYHIKKKKLECIHCGELSEIETANINHDAETIDAEYATMEQKVGTALYQCPECGAEIRSFSEETTVFCTYCGKQTFLKSNDDAVVPSRIIPFEKDKEDIKKAYQNHIQKKMFVPKNIKNAENIKEFRGIYIPHWSMTYVTDDDMLFKGRRSYTKGNYDYTEYYDIHAKVSGPIDDITFDASEAFGDTISYEIAPFFTDEAKPFHEGYVAGFYADKETTKPSDHDDQAYDVITDKIETALNAKNTSSYRSAKIHITDCEKGPSLIQTKEELSLFPVWFLTYRNKDRVSYSVMNGQTGKMSIDLPVDKKSFFGFAGLLGLALSVVFALLFSSILYTTTATTISYFSLILLLLSSFVLHKEMKAIYNRDNDISAEQHRRKIDVKTIVSAFIFIAIFFSIVAPFLLQLFVSSGSTKPTFATVITTVPIVIGQAMLMTKINKYKVKAENLNILTALIITIIGLVLYVIASPNDVIYYGLSIASCIGMGINAMGCINGFDYLTSRPVPNFFIREGAGHER